ncbi:DMT family transporter [Marinivivus vitaminiproducens]|uniref:DMT family transporter n=1 Tax=Marinivivus vitaminiproducens TaxID=3035935 RepID=UPI00279849F1|nr:DMT family transporter [Geminicoccaceae bacterium SCSIO 64248]
MATRPADLPSAAAVGPNLRRPVLLALLLMGVAATGAAPIFVRASEVGPSATGFWRLALAMPVFLCWQMWARPAGGRGGIPARAIRWPLVLAGIAYGLDLALWNASIHLTTAANATLLANLAPVFVVLIGWLAWRDRPDGRLLTALGLALGGALLLVGEGFALGPDRLQGDLLATATAFFYALYLLGMHRARRDADAASAMLWSGRVTMAVLLAAAVVQGERILPSSLQAWWPLLGIALVCHVGGQATIALAMAGLPAAYASVVLLFQPVSGAVLGWLVLGETLSSMQVAGGAVVLSGILLLARSGRPAGTASKTGKTC